VRLFCLRSKYYNRVTIANLLLSLLLRPGSVVRKDKWEYGNLGFKGFDGVGFVNLMVMFLSDSIVNTPFSIKYFIGAIFAPTYNLTIN